MFHVRRSSDGRRKEARHVGTTCLNELAKRGLPMPLTAVVAVFMVAILALSDPLTAYAVTAPFDIQTNYVNTQFWVGDGLSDGKAHQYSGHASLNLPVKHISADGAIWVVGIKVYCPIAQTSSAVATSRFSNMCISTTNPSTIAGQGPLLLSTGFDSGSAPVNYFVMSDFGSANFVISFDYTVTMTAFDASILNQYLYVDITYCGQRGTADNPTIRGYVPTDIMLYDIMENTASLSTDISGVQSAVETGNQQAQDRFDQEVDTANQGSADIASNITQLQSLETKWDILWYPITLTKRFSEMLSGGGTAVAYNIDGVPIAGYRYNSDTGLLEPVLSKTRDTTTGGTVISFPEFTLPVLNVKLWDSYEYDLSTLRTQFPDLFAMSDVVFTVIELLFCVNFLYGKYLAVFGGDD